jgi:hypothetical protein
VWSGDRANAGDTMLAARIAMTALILNLITEFLPDETQEPDWLLIHQVQMSQKILKWQYSNGPF